MLPLGGGQLLLRDCSGLGRGSRLAMCSRHGKPAVPALGAPETERDKEDTQECPHPLVRDCFLEKVSVGGAA